MGGKAGAERSLDCARDDGCRRDGLKPRRYEAAKQESTDLKIGHYKRQSARLGRRPLQNGRAPASEGGHYKGQEVAAKMRKMLG